MSACLFTLRSDTIRAMSTEDLQKAVAYWKTTQNPNPGNRFERDQASGHRDNLEVANAELYCRAAGMEPGMAAAYANREGLGAHPQILKAFADALITGAGYLKIDKDLRITHVKTEKGDNGQV